MLKQVTGFPRINPKKFQQSLSLFKENLLPEVLNTLFEYDKKTDRNNTNSGTIFDDMFILRDIRMKKLVTISFLIVLAATACEKQEVYNDLQGRWKIIGISGTIAGSQQIRNFDIVYFKQSGFYTVFCDGAAIQGGSYSLEKKKLEDSVDNSFEFRVRFTESYNKDPYSNFYTELPMVITFDLDNTLTLSQADISDGFNYHFTRE